MKKILAVLILLTSTQLVTSQVVKTVWSSDFEYGGGPEPCSDTSNYRDSSRPTCAANPLCTQSHGHDWGISSEFQYNGNYSDSAQVNSKDTLWFTTCAFSTLADTFVTVEFRHICKVSIFDGGVVEVSNDSGLTWNVLGINEYINTKQLPPLFISPVPSPKYGVFSEGSYGNQGDKWKSGTDSVPKNHWWEYEYFNVSTFLGGINSSANCLLRFGAFDGPSAANNGPENRYGWLLDSIRVKSAPCENIKPVAEFVAPQIYNGSLIYSSGPFDIFAKMYDDPVAYSGYEEAWLYYTINGVFIDSVKYDSILAPNFPNTAFDSVYKVTLPKYYNGGLDSIVPGDTICYWTIVYDKSIPCRNQFRIPADPNLTCRTFYIATGQALPYCDNFDSLNTANFWDTTMVNGLIGWQLGNPQAGGGYPAHSGTKAWTTVLATNYKDNDRYMLNSPIFDFTSAITPRITFWRRHSMPTQVSDGDRYSLQYSINGNPWITLGSDRNAPTANGDPNGKPLHLPSICNSTWYNSTGLPLNKGWTASNTALPQNNQWRESFYQLPPTFTGITQVQFRFRFNADANALRGYGVSIDDWCIKNPPAVDVAVIEIVRPPNNDYIKRAGEQDSIWIKIRNLGTNTLTSIPLCYDIRDEFGAVDTTICNTINYPHGSYPAGLPPLAIDSIYFYNQKYTVPHRLYQIFAYPNIPNDADSINDTTNTKGHFGFGIDTISHETNFDFAPAKWATTLLNPPTNVCGDPLPIQKTRWERGTPNFGVTNSAYSPPNVWDINLDTAYTVGDVQYLYTNFFDMSNADSAFMSFWHNWNTVEEFDGHYVDFSFNRFVSSTRLTSNSQPVGRKINWIESDKPTQSIGRAWNGLSTGWEYSQVPLNNFNFTGQSEVQFRFVFRTDPATTQPLDGVSIDDFRIVNPDPYDVEMFDIVLPVRGCVKDFEEPVEIVVKNVGKANIDSIPVFYQYRYDATCTSTYGPWSAVVSDTILSTIQPGLDVNFIFEDSVDMSLFGCYEFKVWTAHQDDLNQTNDSLSGHVAENVRGCPINLRVTTGNTALVDGMMLVQDSLTQDTIWMQPMSAIGPNAILWPAEICLKEAVSSYRFKLNSSNPNMIAFWRLSDPFAMSTVISGTGPDSVYFKFGCPPLLSASSEKISIYGPSALPIPQTYNIDVTTRNRGSVRLRYLWITTQIKRVLPTPAPITPIMTFTDSVYFTHTGDPILFSRINTIDTLWDAEPGLYEVCAWTSLPNGSADSAKHDDTTCTNFVVLDTVRNYPYCADFDSNSDYPWAGMSRYAYDTASTFKNGAPSQTHLNGPNSPSRAWMTNLDSNYPILDSSAAYSPEFTMDTSKCWNIEFYHKWKTEHAFDGGTVEFTADSGKTWQVVGGPMNTVDTAYPWSTQNWYNTPYVTGLAGQPHPPGWTAKSSNAYTHSYRDFKLPHIGQNPMKVIFRFRFGSDASVEDEGWVFDDFCLKDNGICNYVSCTDGIKNGDEVEIDCGGSFCDPCENCNDGLLNQNETEVDCGGVCKPCPSCVDGIKNGGEVHPDCGGPDCEPCGTCDDKIQTQNWVEIPGTGVWVLKWEIGVDCGSAANCPECWVGVDELDPNILFLGQSIPNPASDHTIVRFQLPREGNSTLSVRSVLGQEMKHVELNNLAPGVHQVNLDVSTWAAGVYYVSLEFEGERLIEKMVVEKK